MEELLKLRWILVAKSRISFAWVLAKLGCGRTNGTSSGGLITSAASQSPRRNSLYTWLSNELHLYKEFSVRTICSFSIDANDSGFKPCPSGFPTSDSRYLSCSNPVDDKALLWLNRRQNLPNSFFVSSVIHYAFVFNPVQRVWMKCGQADALWAFARRGLIIVFDLEEQISVSNTLLCTYPVLIFFCHHNQTSDIGYRWSNTVFSNLPGFTSINQHWTNCSVLDPIFQGKHDVVAMP